MTPHGATSLMVEMLWTGFWLALPLLVACFIVGVVIGLLQVATSLQDPSVSVLPRLIAFLGTFVICLPWLANKAAAYATAVLGQLGRYAR